MRDWLQQGLGLLLFAALGLGMGLGVQHWRSTADAPVVTRIDRSTPGLPGDRVVLVSLSTCPACAKAREWLGAREIAYVELAVDQTEEARSLAERLDVSAVPVLIVGEQSVAGFDAAIFDELLAAPTAR